jgi:deazaflavin-dependent oxidoreductase (nitroreductase family)
MLVSILIIVGVLAAGLLAIAIVFVLGVRSRSRLVLRPLFKLQRAVSNPVTMKTAGTAGSPYSVIRHRGRKSGREYETPVGVVAAGDTFLIALPYGSQTNWVRNVLASGSASVVHEGRTCAVDRPQVVPMRDVEAAFSASDRRSFRLFDVRECLRVRRADSGPQDAAQT